MSKTSKVALALQMIESAESSIRSAKQVLKEMAGDVTMAGDKYSSQASTLHTSMREGTGRIIEGVFDGQNMIGADKRSYPVPANYASKSKLVPGDVLKLTIAEDGSFVYKQIGPIPRRKIIGTLSYEDGQYNVMAEAKSYKVLLASVTYFKAEVGDQVTLIVPEVEDSEWGAIENVIASGTEESEEENPEEANLEMKLKDLTKENKKKSSAEDKEDKDDR